MRKVNNLLFIGIAAALIGCNTHVENPNDDPTNQPAPVRDLMTYVTTADGTMGFVAVGKDYAEGLNMSPERTMKLNPKVRYQEFEGFGAAITGAAAFNLMQMPAERRQKLLWRPSHMRKVWVTAMCACLSAVATSTRAATMTIPAAIRRVSRTLR